MSELDSFAKHLAASDAEKLCSSEADAAVKETAFGVRDIRIAEALPFNESLAYLNLTTFEGEKLCIEISAAGFRPVGIRYDDVMGDVPPPAESGEQTDVYVETYETIYALLSSRSPGFRHRFSERLAARLSELKTQEEGACT